MVLLTDAELRQLNQHRLAVARLQRDLREQAARADTVQRALSDLKRATDSAGTKVPESVRQEIAAADKELAEIVAEMGAAGGGRGGRGGRGGGGFGAPAGAARTGGGGGAGSGGAGGGDDDQNAAATVAPGQTIQARLSTTTELLNVPFSPGADQRATLQALPGELQTLADRLQRLMGDRMPALVKTLRAAGIDFKTGGGSGP